MSRSSGLRVLAAIALFWCGGCGSNSRQTCKTNASCGGGVCTTYGCVQSVMRSIGPSGGTVRTAFGDVTIEIPAGALASTTPITIRAAGPGVFRVRRGTDNQRGLGTAFVIAEGVSFSQPVKITFSYAGLDLRSFSERELCIMGANIYGGNDETAAQTCTVNLTRKTVSGTFMKGDKFLILAFDSDWEATSRPTVEGTSAGGSGNPINSPDPRPIPVVEEFNGNSLDPLVWRFWTVGTSTAAVQNGVLAATATVKDEALTEAGVKLDLDLVSRVQAAQSRVRMAGTSGAGDHLIRAVEGFSCNTGLDPNNIGGFTGEVYSRIQLSKDGSVGAVVWHCGNADCSDGNLIHFNAFATGVDVTNWHDYYLGFDPLTATYYFRIDDKPIYTYQVDTSQYPVAYGQWLYMAFRAEATTEPGTTASIEVDRVKVGSLADVFGTLP